MKNVSYCKAGAITNKENNYISRFVKIYNTVFTVFVEIVEYILYRFSRSLNYSNFSSDFLKIRMKIIYRTLRNSILSTHVLKPSNPFVKIPIQ